MPPLTFAGAATRAPRERHSHRTRLLNAAVDVRRGRRSRRAAERAGVAVRAARQNGRAPPPPGRGSTLRWCPAACFPRAVPRSRGACWSRSRSSPPRRCCCIRSGRSRRRCRSASSTCSACCSCRSCGAPRSASARAWSARRRSTSSTSRRPGGFTVAEPENWVALAVFLVVAVAASSVAEAARRRAQEAMQRGREADLAAELARVLLGAPDLTAALGPAAQRIAQAFGLASCRLVLGAAEGDERTSALAARTRRRAARDAARAARERTGRSPPSGRDSRRCSRRRSSARR